MCLDGHELGLQGIIRDSRSYMLAQKSCLMQENVDLGLDPSQ